MSFLTCFRCSPAAQWTHPHPWGGVQPTPFSSWLAGPSNFDVKKEQEKYKNVEFLCFYSFWGKDAINALGDFGNQLLLEICNLSAKNEQMMKVWLQEKLALNCGWFIVGIILQQYSKSHQEEMHK